MGLFSNPFLLFAIALSMLLHSVILYVPVLAKVFSTTYLDFNDWTLVVLFSFPVIIIDEILKVYARHRNASNL